MPLLKSVALMLRPNKDVRTRSLTIRTLLLASAVALCGWLLMDLVYQRNVQALVLDSWQQRLEQDARAERTRLRSAMTAFSETAWYLSNYQPLQAQLNAWNRTPSPHTVQTDHWKPDWLATLHSVDSKTTIDHALVFDGQGSLRGVYSPGKGPLPVILAGINTATLNAARLMPVVRADHRAAWLVSAASVPPAQGSVLIASRLDSEFLRGVLDKTPGATRSALFFDAENGSPLAATGRVDAPNLELIANELLLDNHDGRELRYAMWVDAGEISALGEHLVFSVRSQRTLALVVFAGLFSVVIGWIGCRVRKIHRSVDNYSSRMGLEPLQGGEGDPFDQLEKRLERLSEEVIAETSALEYQAQHDSLTSLPNRSLLMERFEAELNESRENEEPLALFVMDLDQFKEVNDTLGHQVGDRLLQEVGRRLTTVLRRTDTVARLGGDEFAVLLPGADESQSKSVCRKILAAMDRPVSIDNVQLRAGISIGVALCPDHAQDATLLLRYADIAMYEAKKKHKGFAFYVADEDEHSISRLGLSGELRDAISDNQLSLVYQPMVDVRSGQIFCAEALVRWHHPEYGLVLPEDFIPSAEQTGVIRPLTLWVIDRALAQAADWARNAVNLRISVNLSVRSLQDRKLPGQVQKLVDEYDVDPQAIILEITESAIMSDPLTARRVMRRLSNMGFQLSIDDFGTGYSSLAYLKQLPVDEIKIDKSFIAQMDQNENDAVIVRATIDLAHNLGLKVVAEGVETTDVWDLLEILGCDIAQGYFIRHPLAPNELAEWICSKRWKDEHWVTPLEPLVQGAS